ncbi:MAG: dockerin type I domain-containing protein, partial [bacterium]|nr:dockerin type I domain-containing protein [bacterium]
AVITSAQSLHNGANEGTSPGEYAVGSKAILQTAINTASLITSSEAQSVVDAAVTTLNSTVAVFSTQIIVGISGESNETPSTNSVTITWTTTHPATSRVIWDTISHNNASTTEAGPVNYGYANSTTENVALITSHSVAVGGLSSGTQYFFRTVSHGSPEVVGSEQTVTTASAPSGGGGGGGGGNRTPVVKKGDANKDGKVDKYDFSLMMANWGKAGINTSDFNGDSKVDKYDFALLMSNWGL